MLQRTIYICLMFFMPMFFGSFKHDIKVAPIAPITPISSNIEHKKLILETLDDIYNFAFADADVQITKVKQRIPNHPISHMLLAMNMDWQWEPSCDDKVKQALIIYHLNRTLVLSDSLLRKKPNDLEVMFIQFTAHGFLARIYAILGNYVDAVNHSMSAYNSVKKGFELKEKFYDFYFSTGMYNYYRERYPELHPIVKPFAAMLTDGNPELGIKQLRFSYAHSLFSKIESANYLINIFYKYESKPSDAFSIAEEVNKKYPNNLFFTVKYAEGIMVSSKNKTDYVALYEKLLESNSVYYQMSGYFFKAQKLYSENKIEEAFIWAHKSGKMSEKLPKLKDNMPSYIHILLGKIYEKKGNSKEAERCFKVANNRAEYPSTKEEAQLYLKKY